MGIGIICAAFAFLLASAFVAEVVVHHTYGPGVWWSGLVAASWVMWPTLKRHQVERHNTLKPVPKKYAVPWKNAFAKVRGILDRATYRMGSRWHVSTADTQGKHIHATLLFTDESAKWEAPGGRMENLRQRVERQKRHVEVDIQFQDQDEETVIQLDFSTQTEGHLIYACDFVIDDIENAIEREIGIGTKVGNPAEFVWEAPPWWLLAVTCLGLMILWQDVYKSVFS